MISSSLYITTDATYKNINLTYNTSSLGTVSINNQGIMLGAYFDTLK